MDAKKILHKIKELKKIENDKELATALDIKYDTLRNWYKRQTLQCDIVVDYAVSHNIDLNYLFDPDAENTSIETLFDFMDDEQKRILNLALLSAHQNNEFDEFISPVFEYYIFSKLKLKFQNIGKEKSFWHKVIFGQRLKNSFILILAKVLSVVESSIKELDIKEDNALELLLSLVENYQLNILGDKFKHLLTESEKDELMNWIKKELTNFDAYVILKNIPSILDVLREEINLLNKKAF